MSSSTPHDVSHFVNYGLIHELDDHRPGPAYGDRTWGTLCGIMDSSANTSVTTASWNRGANRVAESQITSHAVGDTAWRDMTPAAQDRYFEQQHHWNAIRYAYFGCVNV